MNKLSIALAVGVLAVVVIALAWRAQRSTAAPEPTPAPPPPVVVEAEDRTVAGTPEEQNAMVSELVRGNNAFAFALYDALHDQPGNLFVSPLSITTALAMVYEGADGQTAAEIGGVFGLPAESSRRHGAFAELLAGLNPADAPFQLSMANALWAQEDYAFLPSYTETLEEHYDAAARSLDFKAAVEPARQLINDWVAERTQDRIENLFEEGTLNAATRLVLTNAIYFKGDWTHQFDPERTQEEEFAAPDGPVEVPMMRLEDETRFNYADVTGVQALELPYEGERLSMLVLLPRGELSTLEQELATPEFLDTIQRELAPQSVHVHLPRFTFEDKHTLNGALSTLGMPSAFVPGQANFSGIDGTDDLYIDLVVHQSFVEVNEEGTEAAAATGVGMRVTTAMPDQPVLFRADRPFLFMIRDIESGAILFLGRVVNPAG